MSNKRKKTRRSRYFLPAMILLLLGLMMLLVDKAPENSVALKREPVGIMGTSCKLIAIARPNTQSDRVSRAFTQAEQHLRQVESLMSTWIDSSQLSQFNAAHANESIRLDPQIIEAILAAKQFANQTDQAFDVSARPLFQLWKNAAKQNHLPTEQQINNARDASTWDHITIDVSQQQVTKSVSTAQLDLGGIAKGYAIDKAIWAMQQAGITAGLIDVGGDMRCIGIQASSQPWQVKVKSPFDDQLMMTLNLPSGYAVCTSGNYARYNQIGDKRFSHIIDPRTGWPVTITPSVTVIAPRAIIADAWATALSVLGPDGLKLLENHPNIHAMLITGSKQNPVFHQSTHFDQFIQVDK